MANTLAVNFSSFSKFELLIINVDSLPQSVSFTILIDASTLIASGSFCNDVGVLVIGHSLSGNLRKSDPACHPLLTSISIGLLPRVNHSAMLFVLCVQYQWNLTHLQGKSPGNEIGTSRFFFQFQYLLEFLLRVLGRTC